MEVLYTLWQIVNLFGVLLVELLRLAIRWSPLIAWVAFWLWAADWRKLGPALRRGAWAPVVLLAVMIALAWSVTLPSERAIAGGFVLPNFLWQLIAVSGLLALAGFCGSLQIMYGLSPEEINLEPAPGHDHDHVHAAH